MRSAAAMVSIKRSTISVQVREGHSAYRKLKGDLSSPSDSLEFAVSIKRVAKCRIRPSQFFKGRIAFHSVISVLRTVSSERAADTFGPKSRRNGLRKFPPQLRTCGRFTRLLKSAAPRRLFQIFYHNFASNLRRPTASRDPKCSIFHGRGEPYGLPNSPALRSFTFISELFGALIVRQRVVP